LPCRQKTTRFAANRRRSKRRPGGGSLRKPSKGRTLLLRDYDGAGETNHATCVNATAKSLVFKFQAGNFFQKNPHMLDLTVDLVMDSVTGASPATGCMMVHLIDCYCRSGLFCIGPSLHFDACVGIEVNEVALSEVQENAALNGVFNRDFVATSAKAIFSSKVPVGAGGAIYDGGGEDDSSNDNKKKSGGSLVRGFPQDTTVVVVDPSCKGCSVEFLNQLNKYQLARVVYMSCDPATQERDAKLLISFGYHISSIQLFNLFPQTPQTRHIKCLAIFERMDDGDVKIIGKYQRLSARSMWHLVRASINQTQ
jgi:tRNA/tmRNA/rRNA uracil-C5-methylase (TrmA/RlmC/RlmD family)